jgi:O-methyltransferase
MKYEKIKTMSSYAPWASDKSFLKIFNQVKNQSLIDIYRGYGLWEIIHNLKNADGDLIEVGVWKGASSIIIGKALYKIKSKNKFYICDTFKGVVKASKKDKIYKNEPNRFAIYCLTEALICT